MEETIVNDNYSATAKLTQTIVWVSVYSLYTEEAHDCVPLEVADGYLVCQKMTSS